MKVTCIQYISSLTLLSLTLAFVPQKGTHTPWLGNTRLHTNLSSSCYSRKEVMIDLHCHFPPEVVEYGFRLLFVRFLHDGRIFWRFGQNPPILKHNQLIGSQSERFNDTLARSDYIMTVKLRVTLQQQNNARKLRV